MTNYKLDDDKTTSTTQNPLARSDEGQWPT